MTDIPMEGGDSSGDEDETKQQLSAAEQATLARKKRILAMKSRMHGVEMKEEDYHREEVSTKKSKVVEDTTTFRSYEPISDVIGGIDEGRKTNLTAVEEEIQDQLALAADTSVVEQIDLQLLAPKKADWDLKRDITAKMEKLERRTQFAIADLIRDRLRGGEGDDIADAVAHAI